MEGNIYEMGPEFFTVTLQQEQTGNGSRSLYIYVTTRTDSERNETEVLVEEMHGQ
jgi:hypothetical protein